MRSKMQVYSQKLNQVWCCWWWQLGS